MCLLVQCVESGYVQWETSERLRVLGDNDSTLYRAEFFRINVTWVQLRRSSKTLKTKQEVSTLGVQKAFCHHIPFCSVSIWVILLAGWVHGRKIISKKMTSCLLRQLILWARETASRCYHHSTCELRCGEQFWKSGLWYSDRDIPQ